MNPLLPEKSYRGFLYLLKGCGLIFGLACLFKGIAVTASMLINVILKYFFDYVLDIPGKPILVIYIVLLILLTAIIQWLFSYLSGRNTAQAALTIAHKLRTALLRQILLLTFTFHDQARAGELIQKSGSDVESLQNLYNEHLVNIAQFFFLVLINFTAIFFMNHTLALFSLIMIPILAVLSIIFFRIISRSFNKLQQQEGVIAHSVQEYIAGLRVVKAFARQAFEVQKFEEQNRKKYEFGKKWRLYFGLFWPASHLICVFQMIMGLGLSGYLVYHNHITIGTFLAYNALLNDVIWPLQHLGKLISQLSLAHVSYGRIAGILNTQAEDLDIGIKDKALTGDIAFNKVCLAYSDQAEVLQNITFSCAPGELIAIVGPTGSGKSTLLKLLPRFYEPYRGVISINHQPLNCYAKSFLREQIGIVEQSPFLFAATIAENIACGSKHPVPPDDIRAAARLAAIDEEIMSFPRGYQTCVGEKGITLSGGQKQRIVLARALVRNPQLLILDEFTSAVDSRTEAMMRQALLANRQQKTIFMITQHIRNLMLADKILVLQKGKIVQTGNHQTLMQQEGYYKTLCSQQLSIEDALQKEIADARQAL